MGVRRPGLWRPVLCVSALLRLGVHGVTLGANSPESGTAGLNYQVVAGGGENTASGTASAIVGGAKNTAASQ